MRTSYTETDFSSLTNLNVSRARKLDLSRECTDLARVAGDLLCSSFCDPECSSLTNNTDIWNSGVVQAVPLDLADISVSLADMCFETGVRSAELQETCTFKYIALMYVPRRYHTSTDRTYRFKVSAA